MQSDAGGGHLTALSINTPASGTHRTGGTATSTSGPWSHTPVPDRSTEAESGRRDRRCQLCHCVLSRYNEEPYCSGCSRSARSRPQPAPCVPTEVWARADVQRALFTRDFGRLCHLVRIASDLRQSDMADLTGLSQAFLSMLESGARRLTNIDKIVELLDGLNIPVELTGPMLRMPNWMHDPDSWRG
ncbi:helix-turn-helix transcriptional regulator [Streptomyces sp. NPDC047042]|uniref:helix-turn-helix domain-containing protein n=1 Tax=Streptomyces sp. NPDC047042 TaxID=3154807 RepID=UPI0033EFF09E